MFRWRDRRRDHLQFEKAGQHLQRQLVPAHGDFFDQLAARLAEKPPGGACPAVSDARRFRPFRRSLRWPFEIVPPIGWALRVRTVTLVSLPESPRRRAERPARLVRMQAAGRAARCLPQLLVSDQRCIERQRGEATQQAGIITKVHIVSTTAVSAGQFRFRDFLRSVEGHIWRVAWATTSPLVSLSPSASNAFKPASLSPSSRGAADPRVTDEPTVSLSFKLQRVAAGNRHAAEH
jgi:hypothetical protein